MSDGAHTKLPRFLLGLTLALALLASARIASAQSIGVKWNAVTETTGGTAVSITGYHVGYGTSSRSYTLGVSIGNVLLARVDGLSNGKTYFFSVKAIADGGVESDWSAEVSYFVPFESCTNGLDDDHDGQIDCKDSECPPQAERCDGLDNDCNGAVDDGLPAVPCALSRGVCAGSTKVCSGQGGYRECDASRYGADYEQIESRCDGLDNDCDGSVDEGCPCTVGSSVACSTDLGECSAGQQRCEANGMLGPCSGTLPTAEACDGKDNDCDGTADNGLPPAPCPLQQGVCAGALTTCAGASGLAPCTAAIYGPNYESKETRCDGMDNDCDGQVDEEGVCSPGPEQPPATVDPAAPPPSDPSLSADPGGTPLGAGGSDAAFVGSSFLTGCSSSSASPTDALGLAFFLLVIFLVRRR